MEKNIKDTIEELKTALRESTILLEWSTKAIVPIEDLEKQLTINKALGQ